MQYVLLIYHPENAPFDPSIMKEYMDVSRSLRESGKLQAAEPLMPTSTATSVRIRNGETMVTDGPFAETREQLGGFYLIDANTFSKSLPHSLILGWKMHLPRHAMSPLARRPSKGLGRHSR